jgi:antitoxin (DNA-binding transcriptional repressor) of toxin-antitoxin stability system
MTGLAVEDTPAVAEAAHYAAGGRVVYITERGNRVAGIVPAGVAAELERLSPAELAELLEDFAESWAVAYSVEFREQASKALQQLDKLVRERIGRVVDRLAENPRLAQAT